MHTRQEEPQDPTKNYDTRDLPIGGIVKGVTVFFLFTIIMGPTSCGVMSCLGGHVGKPYLGQEPLPMQDESAYSNRRIPGGDNPILQDNITAKADMHNLRLRENEILEKGGVNPTTKTMAIPIETAMSEEAALHGN